MDIVRLIRHGLTINIETDLLAISVTKMLDHYKSAFNYLFKAESCVYWAVFFYSRITTLAISSAYGSSAFSRSIPAGVFPFWITRWMVSLYFSG